MKYDAFRQPVRIFRGLSFGQEVRSAGEALAFLDSWPANHDFAGRIAAQRACRGVLEGTVDADTARRAFHAFARRTGILAPDLEDVMAAKAVRTRRQASEA